MDFISFHCGCIQCFLCTWKTAKKWNTDKALTGADVVVGLEEVTNDNVIEGRGRPVGCTMHITLH